MIKHPFTLLLHIALAIILAGAIVTHYCGIQGELSLTEGGETVSSFVKTSGPGDGKFPFPVALESADIDFYPGTTTPMDFHSHLKVDGKPVSVSMNKVAEIDGWRFYQSGISPDSTRLSVSYDPWGTGITYSGYALLFVSMIGFFFQRNTPWRSLLRQGKKGKSGKEKSCDKRGMPGKKVLATVLMLTSFAASAAGTESLPVMQRPLAANLGKMYVYWNDRVCPLQTMAKDVSMKLYGTESYRGFTPEQILSGWLFYFDTWERDFVDNHSYDGTNAKKQKRQMEREALVNWLGTGEAFKIYPYRAADGHMEWLSLTGRRPSRMSLEQWTFMQTTMPEIKNLLLKGLNIEANDVITDLIAGQKRYAGVDNLPSPARMRAEVLYNRYSNLRLPAVVSLLIGLVWLFVAIRGCGLRRGVAAALNMAVGLVTLYITVMLGVIWYVGGHIPLSNGPEMMMFMGLFALICGLAARNGMLKGAFLTVAAMTLFVGLMGGRTPRVNMLMPVLSSPLLSIHVMLVMTSYVLFLIMAILSGIGLAARKATGEYLCRVNRIFLVPAVFLLAGGIFVGAVWANQSWGRYWGWDPKETCALVTLLIYAVPVHWGSRYLKAFRRPKVLHVYLLLAVLSVLFTYFGANYFLAGMHSYA